MLEGFIKGSDVELEEAPGPRRPRRLRGDFESDCRGNWHERGLCHVTSAVDLRSRILHVRREAGGHAQGHRPTVTAAGVTHERRTVVVTGGSRGIGLMIAEGFVRSGATVLISARTAASCDGAAEALSAHGKCVSVPTDIASNQGRRRLIDTVAERTGRLDVLINNAGATGRGLIDEYPPDDFDEIFAVNVKGVFCADPGFPATPAHGC